MKRERDTHYSRICSRPDTVIFQISSFFFRVSLSVCLSSPTLAFVSYARTHTPIIYSTSKDIWNVPLDINTHARHEQHFQRFVLSRSSATGREDWRRLRLRVVLIPLLLLRVCEWIFAQVHGRESDCKGKRRVVLGRVSDGMLYPFGVRLVLRHHHLVFQRTVPSFANGGGTTVRSSFR